MVHAVRDEASTEDGELAIGKGKEVGGVFFVSFLPVSGGGDLELSGNRLRQWRHFWSHMKELFVLRWKSTSNGQNQSKVWGAEGQRQGGADVSQEVWERESKPQKDVKVQRDRNLEIRRWEEAETHTQRDILLSHTPAPHWGF